MKITSNVAALLSIFLTANGAPVASNTYDVIIVGSGPAGIIVADRMSEAGKKTLLLEQGGPSYGITGGTERPSWLDGTNMSRVDVPGLYKSIFSGHSSLICTADQVASFQGCTVGGNSAINAGLFFQPPASDWDLYFPTGWKNSDMQGASTKVHTKQPSTDLTSTNGRRYLQSGYTAAKQWLVDSAGYKEVGLNDGLKNHSKTKVFGHSIFSYANGQRSGPVKTYLQSARARPNFSMQTHAKVLRVIRNGKTATGVEVSINGAKSTTIALAAGGRVILSAGALQSPQILMWSGIGDPSTLKTLAAGGHLPIASSQWINNTAVGDKLFDNPNTFIELQSNAVKSYVYSYDNPVSTDKELFLKSRCGPYTFASETSSFWDFIKQGNDTVGCQGTIDSAGYEDFSNNNTITLNVYGTSGMRSFGRVNLNEKGVATPVSNFYSDPRDAQAIGTFIHNIFQKLPATLKPLNLAASSSLDQIISYITSNTQYTRGNVNHWSSSCRFGSCVDSDTKVIGTDNIHVVDASISAPLTTNPALGTMIIAERAVERILALKGTKIAIKG